MAAIGSALAPDEVVTCTPRLVNIPNTGLSTPADIVCSQRRFGASSDTRMNASCALRPRVAREERHRDAGDVGLGDRFVAGQCHDVEFGGDRRARRSPYRPMNVSVQNNVSVMRPACQVINSSTNSANTSALRIVSASSCITEISHWSSRPGGSMTPRLMP